jgi:hypothetical protein
LRHPNHEPVRRRSSCRSLRTAWMNRMLTCRRGFFQIEIACAIVLRALC